MRKEKKREKESNKGESENGAKTLEVLQCLFAKLNESMKLLQSELSFGKNFF